MRINVEVFTRDMKGLASRFNSGNAFLDEFIKSDEAFDAGIGKTFVWVDEKRTKIIGYYNIGVGYIDTVTEKGKYKNRRFNSPEFFCSFHGVQRSYRRR